MGTGLFPRSTYHRTTADYVKKAQTAKRLLIETEDRIWQAVLSEKDGALESIFTRRKDELIAMMNTGTIDVEAAPAAGDLSSPQCVITYLAVALESNPEALKDGLWDMALKLLQKDSQPPSQYIDIRDGNDCTPLHRLVSGYQRQGNEEMDASTNIVKIFELLLQRGANFDAVDYGLRTPLHYLVASNNWNGTTRLDLMDRLLLVGCEINTKDNHGDSPLHSACEKRDRRVMAKLIEYGADLHSLDNNWKTPYEVFFKHPGATNNDAAFANDTMKGLQNALPKRKRGINVPPKMAECPPHLKGICDKVPVYLSSQGMHQLGNSQSILEFAEEKLLNQASVASSEMMKVSVSPAEPSKKQIEETDQA
ncbi:hypothetical protein FSARC_1710 [Fusarium sarcochroum]|uniref:Ankyrin repeat protein n=1 Tax=Fusarium sarcochroum TaxID=1208366 RepID=A0A8H4U818_9HYPO|nr:hypothetical protein FSARC_1710 [Fusarium sarcochroum]